MLQLNMNALRVLSILGTRPEAIKLAPVILEMRRHPEIVPLVAVTAQHRQMQDQVLTLFGIRPDYDLDLMRTGQTVFDITSRALLGLKQTIEDARADLVLVQGDTTTVLSGALAAYYMKVPVGHVEAGLRSFDKFQPYPEEVNRRLTSVLADYHFAPTELSRRNLLAENVAADRIFVTGNTAVDALLHVIAMSPPPTHPLLRRLDPRQRLLVVTTHRRENWGEPIRQVARAIRQLIQTFDDVEVVYALHLNPIVQTAAREELQNTPRLHLVDAVDYGPWVQILNRAALILTDSGGIQEEAPSLGKPVLVLRNVTERPEGVDAGVLKIVGTQTADIVREASALLMRPCADGGLPLGNPYGDGHAAERIVGTILKHCR
jgi:UDP-N-acetylglucosamine 2-epimerase (non-hydrolysing)